MHSTLVSAAQLAANLKSPDWIVLDCRHDLTLPQAGRQAYDAGHIPGARFVSVDGELSDKRPDSDGAFRGRHPLPEREAFIEQLRRWGIDDDTQLVAYDAQGGIFAARLWWMLRWAGHGAAAVLDGGWQAWLADGNAASKDESPAGRRGNASTRPALVDVVDADEILSRLRSGTLTVVDARAPDRFRGENETLDPVGGHIPGALNRFYRENLQEDGRFKPADRLAREWCGVLATPSSAVMQCGSGITACHNLLALEIAGMRGAALYPGSWSEWCSDPARPVATGAEL